MSKDTCKTCKFYKDDNHPMERISGRGECLFNPPSVWRSRGDRHGEFPIVLEHLWCGQHKPMKEATDETQ